MDDLTAALEDCHRRMEVQLHSKQIRRPVGPAQLTLLQQVFDTACQQYQISKDSPDGEALALILVNSLQKGMDEKEALAALAEAMAQSR
ncbi:hypothetical protein MUU53_07240 [Rhizobium lemnae]|uniref:DUF982 domain-containing protein n=1 Tax=Rhizobium lemnae TaxID=1214924 RepID=A0ABV8E5N6_9HYPH|nr:hypothetical protein [Rhizobium lemnae]MCJ8507707.1 hypothetical protein [Rhizobium lemnae]